MSEEELVEAARRLSEALRPGDLDATLANITAAAVEVLPGVDSAAFTILHADGTLETVAPTTEDLVVVDAAQYEFREGPCYAAATETVHTASPDLANDPRFPRYAKVAVQHGVRAQAGIRLFDAPKSNGALNLYSGQVGSFSDLGALGVLFAHQAATAIDYAREITNLQEAVTARTAIGQAVGIVMERYGLTDDRAFAFLARLSQNRNVKLRLVAQEIVAATEELGDDDSRGLNPVP
jgi:GAF domain-containing protein